MNKSNNLLLFLSIYIFIITLTFDKTSLRIIQTAYSTQLFTCKEGNNNILLHVPDKNASNLYEED